MSRSKKINSLLVGFLSALAVTVSGCGEEDKTCLRKTGDPSREICQKIRDQVTDSLLSQYDLGCEPVYDYPSYYCCCQSLPLISEEEAGVNIIASELLNLGYSVEKNDGSWWVILPESNAGDLEGILNPDLRFKPKNTSSSYSYFEFNSLEDSGEFGENFRSNFPFYRIIKPDPEERIRQIVDSYLNEK